MIFAKALLLKTIKENLQESDDSHSSIKIIKTQVPFDKLNWNSDFATFDKQVLISSKIYKVNRKE